jgi:hypothetical protein
MHIIGEAKDLLEILSQVFLIADYFVTFWEEQHVEFRVVSVERTSLGDAHTA